ncbi:MAG: cytochrome c [Anaerolineales bacterium]|nr:MAG: cytochrome c [Anaerolineales bacterium]
MIKMKQLSVFLIVLFALLVTACGSAEGNVAAPTARPYTPQTVQEGNEASGPIVGQPENGKALFDIHCIACHDIVEDGVAPGPALHLAGTRMEPDYVKESIIYPQAHDAYLEAELSAVDVDMPTDFAGLLTPQQLEDLVAYVLTLK